jgi:hypothetical protein
MPVNELLAGAMIGVVMGVVGGLIGGLAVLATDPRQVSEP